MTTLKKVARVFVIGIAVLAVGSLISGFWLYRIAANSETDISSSITESDLEALAAFLQQRALQGQAREPSQAADDLQVRLLSSDAEQFREEAVRVSDTTAMTELSQVSSGALQDLLEGEVSSQFPYIWPYVMAGSFNVIGNALGDDPIIGFYNPYFDVVLLTRWRFRDHTQTETDIGFKLMEAVPITGQAFFEMRSSLATDEPVWADSEGIFEGRLVNAARAFVATFEERYPPLSRDSVSQLAGAGDDAVSRRTAVSVTENRVFFLLRWVIDAQNPDAPVNYADAIEQLQSALAADSTDDLEELLPKDNPQDASIFFELGADIREGMKPYLVVEENVIFIDPIRFSTGFISAYFQMTDDEYEPALVALFSMETSDASD